ncbi:glycoside hydrolase family 76 protein [Whalleya microplaca]|nr:glycoside hydrolase family 76 protein [Whalleya microplaca]
MARLTPISLARVFLAAHGAIAGLTVDVDDAESVKAAAAVVAGDLMSLYDGNEPGRIPGLFNPTPPDGKYAWWTGAALWGTMLDYRSRSGNATYDEVIAQGLSFQLTDDEDFVPTNWTLTEGNDDQDFWAMAAVLAEQTGLQAEKTGLLAEGKIQWTDVAEKVFYEQTNGQRRVQRGECKGALRWIISPIAEGYNYVSTGANAGYFNLGAQLARMTNNPKYVDAAEHTYELLEDIGFISDKYEVFDGAHQDKCDKINRLQLSYTAAELIQGCAHLYNMTADDDWKERLDGLLDHTLDLFFNKDGIAIEGSCESQDDCNTDMLFYKGLLHRFLASTMQMAPYTARKILPVLKKSAKAAVAQCTGGDNGRLCGFSWSSGKFDDKAGAGPQMSVLGALVSIMPPSESVSTSAGNSSSESAFDGSADSSSGTFDSPAQAMGDRASASYGAVIGALLLGSLVGLM